jgi:hypothetical protein
MESDSAQRAATRPARWLYIAVVTATIVVGIVAVAATHSAPTRGGPAPGVGGSEPGAAASSGSHLAQPVPAVAAGSDIAAMLTRPDGPVELFWRTAGDDLAHATVTPSGRTRTDLLDADVASTPAAVIDGSLVHVFWAGGDGRLWTGAYQIGGGWTPPSLLHAGPLASAPQAVVSAAGSIDLFWRGSDDQLTTLKKRPDGWQLPVALGGALASKPVPVATSPGMVEVLWQGTNGSLWHHRRDTSGVWSSAVDLDIRVPGPPVVVADGGAVDAFWRGSDGQMWHAYHAVGVGWSGPVTRGGSLSTDPTAVIAGGVIRVYWGTGAGSLGEHWYPGTDWRGPQLVAFPDAAGALTAIGRPNGDVELFGIDSARRVWRAHWSPTTRWIGPSPIDA